MIVSPLKRSNNMAAKPKRKLKVKIAVSQFECLPLEKEISSVQSIAEKVDVEQQLSNNQSLCDNRWSFEFPSQISFEIGDEQNKKKQTDEIKYQSNSIVQKEPLSDFSSLE